MPLTLDSSADAAQKLGNYKWDAVWTLGLTAGAIIMTAAGYADYAGAAGGHAAYLGAAALFGAVTSAASIYKLARSFSKRSEVADEVARVIMQEQTYRRGAEAELDRVAIDMQTLQTDPTITTTPAVGALIGAKATQLHQHRATLAAQRV